MERDRVRVERMTHLEGPVASTGSPVPVWLFAAELSVARAGLPSFAVHDEPEASLEAQLRLQAALGYDSPPYYAYATYGTWESGAHLRYPSSELCAEPTVPTYPVQLAADVKTLALPNVTQAGMLPRARRFSEAQAERGLPVTLVVGGPFTIAANICGLERLLWWMRREPATVHRIVQRASEHLAEVVDHWVGLFDAERLWPYVSESLATNALLSPGDFGAFVLPYQQRLHQHILDSGMRSIVCYAGGDQRRNLAYWAQIPLGQRGIICLGPETDLEEASPFFHGSILVGNLDPALLEAGTPEEVGRRAQRCIDRGRAHPGGFILACGSELAPETPDRNIENLVEAARSYDRA